MSRKICFLHWFSHTVTNLSKSKWTKSATQGQEGNKGAPETKSFYTSFSPKGSSTQPNQCSMFVSVCVCVCVYAPHKNLPSLSLNFQFFHTCQFIKEVPCWMAVPSHTHTHSLNTRHLLYASLPAFQRRKRRRRKGRGYSPVLIIPLSW